LVRQLDALGLSFEQLQRVADEFGIEILASGNLVGEALVQLQKAIIEATEEAFDFDPTVFQDQLTIERLESRAAGIDQTPAEILRQQLEAAGAVGADAVEQFFGGIDLGDPEAIRDAVQAAIDAWKSGAIAIEDLGGLTREEWLEIIESGLDAADAMDGLSDAARDAVDAMLNVPRGFRQAALAFEAQDPGGVAPNRGRELGDALPLIRGGDGAALPTDLRGVAESIARQRPNITFERGAVVIEGANKSADELLDDVMDAAERRSSAAGVTLALKVG
jgi:hypothetical protein